MGFQIEDGAGGGKLAKVNSEQQLLTRSIVQNDDYHANVEHETVWSTSFENLSPTGTGDYIYYLKNTGDNTLHISDLRLSAETTATQISIHTVSGTASGGTDITPIPRTVQSAAIPTALIQQGSDITGLSDEGLIFYMQLDTVGKMFHLSTSSRIRIPKGKAIAIQVETATASLTGVVSVVKEESDVL